MPCGDRLCEFHDTLFHNDFMQRRRRERKLDLSAPRRPYERPCTETNDCRCYVCSWVKVGELPMSELDERTEPWSLDAKHIFRCIMPGNSGSPEDDKYRLVDTFFQENDVNSKPYANALQRYLEHPYPKTKFEKIWGIRPVRIWRNNTPATLNEWDCMPSTIASPSVIDVRPPMAASGMFRGLQECHIMPFADVACIDRELIENFRPHAELPSVEALTGAEVHPRVIRFKTSLDKLGYDDCAAGEVAHEADNESAPRAMRVADGVAHRPYSESLADEVARDTDEIMACESSYGDTDDESATDESAYESSYGDTDEIMADEVAGDTDDESATDELAYESSYESDSEDECEAQFDEEGAPRCALRKRPAMYGNGLYWAPAKPSVGWDPYFDLDSQRYRDAMDHYQDQMWERRFSGEEYELSIRPYHHLQIEVLFALAARISAPSFETYYYVPLAIRMHFRAALVHAALGDRLPAEICRMIAAYDPAVMYHCHTESQSFLTFPRV
ncbi:hypothetical protein BDZ88DRAFT_470229 [Geranomyces variabilis]|nr:hypothetical protein BDZ88DRAFT_470229 [Geranomyces variabilis]KAJ3136686.1 hypothetical protein HDU90_003063 [Geranomyces variabilis]